MISFFRPFMRSVVLLPASSAWLIALGLIAFNAAQAQTQFTHDAAGHRIAQQTASPATPPVITVPPATQVAVLGGTAQFSVVATGPGPFTYDWFKDGVVIPGANSDTLVLTSLQSSDFTPTASGTPRYYVRVSNANGSDFSNSVALYKDSTRQGLPDWWRQQFFGSLAAVNAEADADGDGVTNRQEFLDGTSPTNGAQRRARVMLVGPQSLMSKFPESETYAEGSTVTAYGSHSGEVQFGGFTGTRRTQSATASLSVPGSGTNTADVVLKGLFGSMPVQKAGASPTFAYSTGDPASVTSFATSPNGQWLAGGFFNRVNDLAVTGVARFAADGTLDTAFNPSPNGEVKAMLILPDGKVLLGGLFNQIYGQPRSGLVRILPGGAVDSTFAPAQGVEDTLVTALEAQRDGKVVAGGQLWDGSAYRPILRLNSNGSVDATFSATMDDVPSVIRQQSDGRLLVGGNFTQVNGQAVPKLVRLNLDGTLDTAFNVTVAAGAVTTRPARALVQPDGKILVGGAVQVRLNGSDVLLPLVRLNADGTLDTAFTQKVQAQAPGITFADITLQTDGRIVGVGTFTLASPSVVNAVRFKQDGTMDPDCFVISRPNAPVRAVAAQTDGSLLMGGSFSDVAVSTAMVNNHSYLKTAGRVSWSQAERLATQMGGHLVSLGSAKENTFVSTVLMPAAIGNAAAWIGLHDVGTEGLYSWSSGELLNFTSWQAGEPNNYNNEDFGVLNYFLNGQGNWVDTPEGGVSNPGMPNDGPYYGIIEIDPGATPPTTQNWVAGRDLMTNEQAGATQELTNPNSSVPQWSYGTRATQASATNELNLYASPEHTNRANWEGWVRTPGYSTLGVVVNPAGDVGPTGTIRSGELVVHPPPTGYTVTRWTAPTAGVYSVAAIWQDVDWSAGDGCNVCVVKNGTSILYSFDFDNGNGAFFTEVLTLASGDVIDFMIGGRSTDLADTARFNAMITRVNNASHVWVGGRDLAANEKPDTPNQLVNPNPTVPQWTYGTRSTYVSAGIDLYPVSTHVSGGGVDGPMEGWGAGGAALLVNTGTALHTYNYGFGPNLSFNPKEMLVAPAGSSGPHPVVRWTAPQAGRYDVLAYWQDSDFHGGNGFSAHLLVNGAQLYGQDNDNAHGCSTVQSLDLKAGDLVDFVLGVRGDFSFDVTKFNVVISKPADSLPRAVATGTVTQATTRAAISETGRINWEDAGPLGSDIAANPFAIESSAGHRFIVRKSTLGSFKRLAQGAGWSGNFASGDALLSHGNSDGPVLIEHASLGGGCSAIGMQIMANQDGPFTATLRAYDANGTLLGTFTAAGNGNANADNSAVFLGVKSTAENIHSVTIDTDSTAWGGDFAINQVSIQASSASSLSNPRANFVRLVSTNSVRPLTFAASASGPTFPSNASATFTLTSEATGSQVSHARLESSLDGMTFLPVSYGSATSASNENWSFPVAALPPGANYFRAVLRNADREEARTHAVGPLITPPVVTSGATMQGEVGTPLTYIATATGRLTDFTTASLPAWATATFDANSSRLTITGTPTVGGTQAITLQPVNEAGAGLGTLTLTITSPFSGWRETYFTPSEQANPAISGPLGDATGAGIPNLLKYALGIPPKQPGRAGLPTGTVSPDGASKYLTLTYTRDVSANVTFTVEVSGNLTTWDSGPAHTTEVTRVPQAGNKETVTVRDNVPNNGGQRRFIRLKVTE